ALCSLSPLRDSWDRAAGPADPVRAAPHAGATSGIHDYRSHDECRGRGGGAGRAVVAHGVARDGPRRAGRRHAIQRAARGGIGLARPASRDGRCAGRTGAARSVATAGVSDRSGARGRRHGAAVHGARRPLERRLVGPVW
ncbi:MAG: hypothetical protein ACK55I_06475, partial [bacterium]